MAESLAVKYRPKTFNDGFLGQNAIIKILKRQIETCKISNCYLFCGPSGTGKTSSAKVLASIINKNQGSPIEIDAASNNGVDNVRAIIDQAKERSIDSEYKIFIIDECFAEDTPITTVDGIKQIKDIVVGDNVINIEGINKVQKVLKHNIPNNRLCNIHLSNGEVIHTSIEHLFLTPQGWIPAKDLLKGDELLNGEAVRDLWKNIPAEARLCEDMQPELREKVSTQEEKIQRENAIHKIVSYLSQGISNSNCIPTDLLNSLWQSTTLDTQKTACYCEDIYSHLYNLWNAMDEYSCEIRSNLFSQMLLSTAVAESESVLCFRSWDEKTLISITKSEDNYRLWNTNSRAASDFFEKNDRKQSFKESSNSVENKSYESIEWDTTSMDRTSRRQWRIYRTADEIAQCFRRFMDIGVSSSNSDKKAEQSKSLSYKLQVRPCLSFTENRNRGGWQYASIERSAVTRYEERNMSESIRVESVTFYKPGDRYEFGWCGEQDTIMYDLCIEGHPSYIASNVVVHNCHQITGAGWAAFLKCLEEPPKYTIFMFCTTNPEKIPDTILNRVMRFNLTKVDTNLIRQRLEYICQQEGFTNYVEACDFISKLASGGVRDAIAMLEKCAGYDNDLSIQNVLTCLGNFSYDILFNLTGAILNNDEGFILEVIDEYYNSGSDLKIFIEQYLDFVIDLTKYCLFKDIAMIKIPSSLKDRCDGYSNIPDILSFSNNLVEKVLTIKNAIKYDTNIKTTIEAMFIALSRS